jgi:cytochrome-b5 reductase
MTHQVEIQLTEFVTHDVKRFVVTKPEGFRYEPGQGVHLAIDEKGLRDEERPFTPTSHPDDEVLEFTIKEYPRREGVTAELHDCKAGDTLKLSEPFGTIQYKGPGVFIAAGAGLTPFLAIIRKLARAGRLEGHRLIFSNDAPKDVICEKELREAFGDRCHLVCTKEGGEGYDETRVDKEYLERKIDDWNQQFYICGPPSFVEDVKSALKELGASASSLVYER